MGQVGRHCRRMPGRLSRCTVCERRRRGRARGEDPASCSRGFCAAHRPMVGNVISFVHIPTPVERVLDPRRRSVVHTQLTQENSDRLGGPLELTTSLRSICYLSARQTCAHDHVQIARMPTNDHLELVVAQFSLGDPPHRQCPRAVTRSRGDTVRPARRGRGSRAKSRSW